MKNKRVYLQYHKRGQGGGWAYDVKILPGLACISAALVVREGPISIAFALFSSYTGSTLLASRATISSRATSRVVCLLKTKRRIELSRNVFCSIFHQLLQQQKTQQSVVLQGSDNAWQESPSLAFYSVWRPSSISGVIGLPRRLRWASQQDLVVLLKPPQIPLQQSEATLQDTPLAAHPPLGLETTPFLISLQYL